MGFTSTGRDQGSQFFFELPLHSAASAGVDGRVSSSANANLTVNVMRVKGPERKRRKKPTPAPSAASFPDTVEFAAREKVYSTTIDLEQDVVEIEGSPLPTGDQKSSRDSEGTTATATTSSGGSGRGISSDRSPMLPLEDIPRMTLDLESESEQLVGIDPPPRPLSTFLMKAEQYSQVPSSDSLMDSGGGAGAVVVPCMDAISSL